jgi:hypothetical protein
VSGSHNHASKPASIGGGLRAINEMTGMAAIGIADRSHDQD